MLYAIIFQDNPTADPDIRPKFMPQHLAFLEANASAVRAAGPMKEADGSVRGGMWLVDIENEAEGWDLVKADPFWPTGLRDKVEIKEWFQVFADGKRQI